MGVRRGLLALLAAAAWAGPDTTYKDKLHAIEKAEAAFWDAYNGRHSDAARTFEIPTLRAHTEPSYPQNARPDYSGYRSLYGDFDDLQRQRADAALEFARSGHPKAAETLFRDLLDVAARIDELDAAIYGMKVAQRNDLRPGIERNGLETRENGLLRALAACPGSPAFLEASWPAAEKKDGRKSFTRRVAVLDALGMTRDAAASKLLGEATKAEASSLRIAALEALAPFAEARELLVPMLDDKSPVVRFALLGAIRKVPDKAWIAPVYARYRASSGRMGAELATTLEGLSGRKYGDDRARWAAWYTKYEANPADVEKIDVEAVTQPAQGGMRFYGVPAASDRVIFVLEGSNELALPADADFQATRFKTRWGAKSKDSWQKDHEDHITVLRRELVKTVDGMPKEARFAIVALRDNDVPLTTALLAPDARGKREVEKLLDDLPGSANRVTPMDGLLEAMRIAGLDPAPGEGDFHAPKADTIFLFHPGAPAFDEFCTADSMLRAFRRLNRFRRLVVHAVRICIPDPEEEAVMRGLAEASGGTFTWQRKPPP